MDTETITALVSRVKNISEIAIALQPSYGLGGTLEAARREADGRARAPWIAWANGLETALTEAEYNRLRAMGAEEVDYAKLREYCRAWEANN